MDLNQAKGVLLEKLIDRGLTGEQAAKEVQKFCFEQTSVSAIEARRSYPEKWLAWKSNNIIEAMKFKP